MDNNQICARACIRKDCTWLHEGICCCYKSDMKRDKYCNCLSYSKKNRIETLHKEVLSLYKKGDILILPDNILGFYQKRGNQPKDRQVEILDISAKFTEVRCIDNPKFQLRTTVWNYDILKTELTNRRQTA